MPAAEDSDGITINTKSPNTIFIPVTSGEVKFRDYLEMLSFLDRVIADLSRDTRLQNLLDALIFLSRAKSACIKNQVRNPLPNM